MQKMILGLLFMGLLLSGCTFLGQGSNVDNTTTNTTTPAPVVKNPTFSIVSPTELQVITTNSTSTDVQLMLSVQNLIIKSPGGVAKKGEGHFKVTVDGGSASTVTSKNFVLSSLSAGDHHVKVELINNDGKSYSISKEISFTLSMEAPLVYNPVNYVVNISNFQYNPSTINAKVGDTVTFVNTGSFPRSATSFDNGKELFNTGVLGPGQNDTINANRIGSFEFYDVTQRSVIGRLVVSANDTG